MIPQAFIDELLSRIDIVEIINPRLTLKKTGQNYTGLCPFHGEKTPSFTVSPDKQFYHCFGCQVSGNALQFLMAFEQLDFIVAIEMLATKAGLEIPKASSPASKERQQERKSIYQILAQSTEYYQTQLKEHPGRNVAVNYLKERGLSGTIAKNFGLGFAPQGWDNLYLALAKTNHEHDLLRDSGMVVEKTTDGQEKRYDRFRERIMFPIRDMSGRVIAFGGRAIGADKPKYLNSPETPVFHKGRALYGLYEARKHNRKLDSLIVVEGYMDVVALAQHGLSNAVATLGTATTPQHLARLFQVVPRIIFAFDGDKAGRNAAWKALLAALSHMSDGRSARFLFVPDGEDPDSLIRLEGKKKFALRLAGAMSFSDFFYQTLTEGVNTSDFDGKAELGKLAMALILKMPKGIFRELMLNKLSKLTNLTADRLMQLSIAAPPEYAADPSGYGADDHHDALIEYDDPSTPHATAAPAYIAVAAKRAISILLCVPDIARELSETDYSALGSTAGFELLVEVIGVILSAEIKSSLLLLSYFEGRLEFVQLRQLAEKEPLLNVSQMYDELIEILDTANRQKIMQPAASRYKALSSKLWQQLTKEEKLELVQLVKIFKV